MKKDDNNKGEFLGLDGFEWFVTICMIIMVLSSAMTFSFGFASAVMF